MITRRVSLKVLFGSLFLVITAAHAAAAVTTTAPDTDHEVSFLPSQKTHLRIPKTISDPQRFTDLAGPVDMNLASLTEQEQLDLITTFKSSMVTLVDDLDKMDLSELPEDIANLTGIGKEYSHQAIKVVEDALAFLKQTIVEPQQAVSTEQVGSDGSNQREDQDDDLFSKYDDESETAGVSEVSRRLVSQRRDYGSGGGGDGGRFDQERFRAQQEHGSSDYEGGSSRHYTYGGQSYHHFANSHHARKLQEMTDALYSGDIHGAFNSFGGGTHNTPHSQRSRVRRLEDHNNRRLSEEESCELLADCVRHMSMYDTFVYYYSDDIDPAKGEIDKNLQKFDENNIARKYELVQTIAKKIEEKGWDDKQCSSLLSEFHRTIEHGSIPEWQGASVNQVCLAEGTQVLVKFDEIVNALVDDSFDSGYNKVSEEMWIKDTEEKIKMVAENIAVEPFQCAEELFYKGDRKDEKEYFPFEGCKGKDSNKCAIEKYRFPVKVDVATDDTKGTTYETVHHVPYCDKGYEITNEKDCTEAGAMMGGLLKKGKIEVIDSSKHPCGCQIYRKKRIIQWNKRKQKDGCRPNKYHVAVCVERRNRDDFEIVQHKTKCDKGFEIKSERDCAEAGQAVGGWLDDGKVYNKKHDHTPCGCYLNMDDKIHFDNKGKCANKKYGFQSVCQRKKRDYVVLRKRNRCDPGYEIKSENECKNAVKKVDGWLKKWKSRSACGCYLWHSNKHGLFNKRKEHCGMRGEQDVICKQRKRSLGEDYKRIAFTTKCPAGTEVTTIEECRVAGLAVGGYLDDWKVVASKDWGHTPCGCFLDRHGKIHFDTGKDKCANNEYLFDNVCHQSGEGGGTARDKHGKLRNNDEPAFITMTFDEIMRKADSCIADELVQIDEDCSQAQNDSQNGKKQHKDLVYTAEYYECRVEKRRDAIEVCDRFGPIQKAMKLVFGKGTSPGHVCGVKEAVVNDEASMPGSCCLDAPYEIKGDLWGQPFDCELGTCKNPGPYLAGINEDACKAAGGTFCPSKANCKDLEDCLKKMKQVAKDEDRPAFLEYLNGAPPLNSTDDRHQCGSVRNYFGFDELFINDRQICEDIEQLKFSRDFEFLNQFFKQGHDDPELEGKEAPDLRMIPPDRTRSEDSKVKGHVGWKAANFALSVAAKAIAYVKERIEEKDCPCDAWCVSTNICNKAKDMIEIIFSIVLLVLEKIFMVAAHLCAIMSQKPKGVRAEENTEVIYENMQLMADYLVEMRTEIRNHRALMTLSLPGREEDSATDSNGEEGPVPERNDCPTPHHFEVKLEILQRTEAKSVFALSSLNGERVEADFKFSKVGQDDTEVMVDFNKTNLKPGMSILHFGGEDADDIQFLIMEATPVSRQDIMANDLVSFA